MKEPINFEIRELAKCALIGFTSNPEVIKLAVKKSNEEDKPLNHILTEMAYELADVMYRFSHGK